MLRSADDGIALAYERSPLLGKKSNIHPEIFLQQYQDCADNLKNRKYELVRILSNYVHNDKSANLPEMLKMIGKDVEEVRALYPFYKKSLDEAYHKIADLRTKFEEARQKAGQLQEKADGLFDKTTDSLFDQYRTKKALLDLIKIRVVSTEFINKICKKKPLDIKLMVLDEIKENIKEVVNEYTSSEKLNPSDFEVVKSILTEVNDSLAPNDMYTQLKKDFSSSDKFRESMGLSLSSELILKEFYNVQNQIFKCMADANQMLHTELEAMHLEFGHLDDFLECASNHYSARDKIIKLEDEITPLFKINIDDYSKISYKDSRSSKTSIKEENWEKFRKNFNTLHTKIHSVNYHLDLIESEIL
jgi:hypothetical protein